MIFIHNDMICLDMPGYTKKDNGSNIEGPEKGDGIWARKNSEKPQDSVGSWIERPGFSLMYDILKTEVWTWSDGDYHPSDRSAGRAMSVGEAQADTENCGTRRCTETLGAKFGVHQLKAKIAPKFLDHASQKQFWCCFGYLKLIFWRRSIIIMNCRGVSLKKWGNLTWSPRNSWFE